MKVLILRLLLISAAEGTQASFAACFDFLCLSVKPRPIISSWYPWIYSIMQFILHKCWVTTSKVPQGSLSFSDSEHICLCWCTDGLLSKEPLHLWCHRLASLTWRKPEQTCSSSDATSITLHVLLQSWTILHAPLANSALPVSVFTI